MSEYFPKASYVYMHVFCPCGHSKANHSKQMALCSFGKSELCENVISHYLLPYQNSLYLNMSFGLLQSLEVFSMYLCKEIINDTVVEHCTDSASSQTVAV
jgi:hypothetical protein